MLKLLLITLLLNSQYMTHIAPLLLLDLLLLALKAFLNYLAQVPIPLDPLTPIVETFVEMRLIMP